MNGFFLQLISSWGAKDTIHTSVNEEEHHTEDMENKQRHLWGSGWGIGLCHHTKLWWPGGLQNTRDVFRNFVLTQPFACAIDRPLFSSNVQRWPQNPAAMQRTLIPEIWGSKKGSQLPLSFSTVPATWSADMSGNCLCDVPASCTTPRDPEFPKFLFT